VDGTVLTDDQTSVEYTITLVAQRAMSPGDSLIIAAVDALHETSALYLYTQQTSFNVTLTRDRLSVTIHQHRHCFDVMKIYCNQDDSMLRKHNRSEDVQQYTEQTTVTR